MTEFTLDTSGVVLAKGRSLHSPEAEAFIAWSDLDPFTQGFGRAMAQELYERLISEGWTEDAALKAIAFQNWHPETLAAILKDCAVISSRMSPATALDGAICWAHRQSGLSDELSRGRFPSLTLYLDENGKVRFR